MGALFYRFYRLGRALLFDVWNVDHDVHLHTLHAASSCHPFELPDRPLAVFVAVFFHVSIECVLSRSTRGWLCACWLLVSRMQTRGLSCGLSVRPQGTHTHSQRESRAEHNHIGIRISVL